MPKYIGYNFTGTANSSVTKNLPNPNAVDSNFANTVLLLHGDGTNTGNNNTFLDSSSNAFTITRNYNATQGTFSPFSKADGRWGSYFDGTGDYLEGTNTATLNFGSGDWTVEAWVYLFTTASFNNIVHQATDSVDGWLVDINTSGNARIVSDAGGTWGVDVTGSTALSTNTWYHLAFVRNGSDWRIYVNGVSDGSATISDSIPDSSANFQIGSLSSLSRYFSGYISNLRVVKGTAVYTGAFTPSTTPLTNITNTSLLTCQSNRFKDNSSNDFTITSNGNVAINPFSPFADTTNYSAATKGGSGYFDGTNDYLTAAGDAAFAFGTGDFTVELWLYASVSQSDKALVGNRNTTGNTFWLIKYGAQYGYTDSISIHTGSSEIFNDIGTIAPATWNHIAWVRSSATNYLYINGTLASSTGTGGAFNFSSTTTMYVGKDGFTAQAGDFNGYISDVRLVKGTAVYTTDFTPPTAPLTAISNTSLLLNFTNGQIIDSTGMNDVETVADAQISTSVYKYGTGSMYFDGSGDYLKVPAQPSLYLQSGDWTIEFWMRLNTTITGQNFGIGQGLTTSNLWHFSNGVSGDNTKVYVLFWNGSSSTVIASATGVLSNSDTAWHHWAVVNNGGTVTIYKDGTSVASGAFVSNSNVANNFLINAFYGTASFFIGSKAVNYDDFRITKGVARYTGTFTPPTRALDEVEPALVTTVDTKYNSGIWSISDSSGEEYSLFTRRKQGNWLITNRGVNSFIYPAAATTVTTHPDGDHIIQYNSSGTLEILGPDLVVSDYLIIGAGGGGGGYYTGGGGGAGAYREGTNLTIPTGSHTVTIGAGGRGNLSPGASDAVGFGGGNTSIGSVITAIGGGGGGGYYKTTTGNPHYINGAPWQPSWTPDTPTSITTSAEGFNYVDGPGSATVHPEAGSAGGHSSYSPVSITGPHNPWSTDNNPTVYPSPGYGGGTPGGAYGNAGGGVRASPYMLTPNSIPTNPIEPAGQHGGGGGGASQAGRFGSIATPGIGGNGTTSSITGSPVTRAGGGGGGSAPAPVGVPGGTGGGGISGSAPSPTAGDGTVNTGSGGGSAYLTGAGGAGGSGLVVLKFPQASHTLVST